MRAYQQVSAALAADARAQTSTTVRSPLTFLVLTGARSVEVRNIRRTDLSAGCRAMVESIGRMETGGSVLLQRVHPLEGDAGGASARRVLRGGEAGVAGTTDVTVWRNRICVAVPVVEAAWVEGHHGALGGDGQETGVCRRGRERPKASFACLYEKLYPRILARYDTRNDWRMTPSGQPTS